jgi:DNA-binding IclR family transcriptional regulator
MPIAAKTRRRRTKLSANSKASNEISAPPEHYSKSIGRAIQILEYFTDPESSLSMTEIAKLSDIPEASLFRILSTLEHHRYLSRNVDGSYSLTSKVMFGTLYEHAEEVRQKIHPLLVNLNHRFDETVSLAYMFGDKIQVIDVLEGFKEIRATNTRGKLLPPHCSSMAKAITAYQPRERLDRIIQAYGLVRFTEKTIVDRLSLNAEYEKIRRNGWSVEREESSAGICCFGAPIFNEKHHAVAAISVMCPLNRVTPELEKEIIAELLDTVQSASQLLQSKTLETQPAMK